MRTLRFLHHGLAAILIVGMVAGCGRRVAVHHAAPAGPMDTIAHVDGIKLQLAAVSDDAAEKSWSPNGVPLKEWVFPDSLEGLVHSLEKPAANVGRMRSFVVRFDGVSAGKVPSVAFRIGSGEIKLPSYTILENSQPYPADKDKEYWLAAVGQEMGTLESVNVAIGLSAKPWTTVSAYKNDGGKFVLSQGSEFPLFVQPESPPAPVEGEDRNFVAGQFEAFSVTVDLPKAIQRRAFRLIALNKSGKEMRPSGAMTESGKSLPSEFFFQGRIQDVDLIELQTRDYSWTEFKNVRLDPD